MSETMSFPEIAEPVAAAAAVATKPANLTEVALSFFTPLEKDMSGLAKKYKDVAFDLSSAKGLKAAKDARLELRESGRFAIQRLRDRTKDQLNDCKKAIEKESERLIAIVQPVEDAVDEQIKAHEKKAAEEKAERERKEAERRQRNLDAIATIRGYAEKARGVGIDRLKAGIAFVEQLDVSEVVEPEFVPQAEQTRTETLATLRQMLADAEAAAAADALRLENARIAAELAEQQRKLAEQAAELERQKRELEAAQQRAAAQATADAAKDQRSEMAVSTSAGQHSQESAGSTPAGRQGDDAHGGAETRGASPAEDSEDLPGVAPGPLHHFTPAEPGPLSFDSVAADEGAANEDSGGPTYPPRGMRRSMGAAPPEPVESATAAELRNEWALFEHAVEHIVPTINKHAAQVDSTRFLAALARMRQIFA